MGKVAFARVDQISSVATHQLGDVYPDSYGREFVYAKAGGSNLARGKLAVAPTVVANHIGMSFAVAPTSGDTSVQVTLGGTAITADQYKDGWLTVQAGTGLGRSYPIEGNLAQTSTTGTATIYLKEAIDTTGALSESNVDLVAGNFNGSVISATDQADMPIGVPLVAVTTSYYYWSQYKGPCSVLIDATTPAVGDEVTISAATAGSVGNKDADTEPLVGTMGQTAGTSAAYQLVNLAIQI